VVGGDLTLTRTEADFGGSVTGSVGSSSMMVKVNNVMPGPLSWVSGRVTVEVPEIVPALVVTVIVVPLTRG